MSRTGKKPIAPVSGVTVTFAAPGSGASGSFAGGQNTAVTDAIEFHCDKDNEA